MSERLQAEVRIGLAMFYMQVADSELSTLILGMGVIVLDPHLVQVVSEKYTSQP